MGEEVKKAAGRTDAAEAGKRTMQTGAKSPGEPLHV
jgi:hypothetical protein